MDLPTIILAILAVAVAAGGVTAYYRRSEGKETIDLLQVNNSALKDENSTLKNRVIYLQGVIDEKDRVISKLTGK